MAEIVLFHHAQGLTAGVTAFADELRTAGHIVHTPDLFDGRIFDNLEQGMRFVSELGFGEVIKRGEQAVQDLPSDLVYAGFSLGVVSWLKRALEHAGLFYLIRVYRSPSLGRLGRRNCLFKYMAWMPIRSLLEKAILTQHGSSLHKQGMANSFSTQVISIILRTVRFHTMTLRQPRFY